MLGTGSESRDWHGSESSSWREGWLSATMLDVFCESFWVASNGLTLAVTCTATSAALLALALGTARAVSG